MIAEDPTDLESKFAYAKYLNENGRHQDSIDQLFIIMIQNKYWNDNQAFDLLIEIFNKLGNTNDIVVQSRKKLSEILI